MSVKAHFSELDVHNLRGKTAIVTGANSGLGFEISKILANHGVRVVMACRDDTKANSAAEEIRGGKPEGEVDVWKLDLSRLASVESFADKFRNHEGNLDYLVNNAGLMAIDQSRTVDGFETQFQVNYLSHFALTSMLMPALLETPNSRIVSISSSAHRQGKMDFSDLMFEHRPYSRWGAYAQSKLAILLFISELNRKLGSGSLTMALAAHPGVAKTRLGQNAGGLVGFGFRLSAPLLAHSAYKGAMPALRALTDIEAKGGEYYGPRYALLGDPILEAPSSAARQMADAKRLWDMTIELTGKDFSTLIEK